METAANPSASAISIAARAMRSTVSAGLGPRLGCARSPHSSSTLPACSPGLLSFLVVIWVVASGLAIALELCLVYTASEGHS